MMTHAGAMLLLGAAWFLPALLGGTVAVAAEEKTGFIVLPNAGPHFAGPRGRSADVTEMLATKEQTGGAIGLYRQIIAPKSGPPTHIHHANDEFFYVVSGNFIFKLGDQIVSAPAQSFVFVPRGTVHTFRNVGTEPGVLLEGVTPGGLEQMFVDREDMDAEMNRALPGKYNTENVGPPLD